ncbi:MAG: DUF4382 domain-containing protein [Planctomycetota bacterium]|nr:DUF4382 domain-containing protein [Planctomycetota bacterium]
MRWLVLPTLALLFVACGGADYWSFTSVQNTNNPYSSFVVVWLSDSPVDGAEQLEVTIERVELLRGTETEELDRTLQTHDLLTLRNGVRASIGEADVPAGGYTGVRLTLRTVGAEAPRMRIGGTWHPLALASGVTRVVDVPFSFSAPDAGRREIQIDFNARLSVRDIGGGYELTPVLDAVNPVTAGEISGRVLGAGGTPVGGMVVIARRQGVELRSTVTLPDGSYRLTPLAPGTYDVEIVNPGGTPVGTPGVLVSSGSAADVILNLP